MSAIIEYIRQALLSSESEHAIKLDDLVTPADTIALNASITRHGLLRKLDNSAVSFLNGQGNWAVPPAGATTLTGNVTGSGTGSFATTIANGVVTLAKMADMTTSSLIYRKTAGSGAPEVNTLATLKTDLALVKDDVGLGNVDNTSDANKPVATAVQTLLDLKQAILVSGVNIKTVNASSLLGAGDLAVTASDPSYSPGPFTVATETAKLLSRHLKLTGVQRATLAGTAMLRIS